MNSRQLQYAILLSKAGSFSAVADKLNISQPALSKQILALESELGVKLFDRSTSPLSLTAAGKHFIREAEAILYKEEQLMRSMEGFKSGDAGELVIGITPFRSSYMLSGIINKVRSRFPNIRIKLVEAGSDILRQSAAEGRFDFAVVNLPVDDSVLNVIPLEEDRLAIAVPKALEDRLDGGDGSSVCFKQCKRLPFAVVGQTQEMRILFDRLCAHSDFTPTVAVEAVSLTTAWEVACSGAAATVMPMQFIEHARKPKELNVYELKDEIYTRKPAIVLRRDQYVSECAEYAIELLKNK